MSDSDRLRAGAPGLTSGLDQNLQQPFDGRDVDARPGSVRRAVVALATSLVVLAVAVAALLLR